MDCAVKMVKKENDLIVGTLSFILKVQDSGFSLNIFGSKRRFSYLISGD